MEPLRGSRAKRAKLKMKSLDLTVVIEKDEDGRFLAICPGLQGCYTEGESEAEARSLIKEAIRLHVEDCLERGEPIYEGSSRLSLKVASTV
jgi:predicted RNase H-like HicB family nuclease